jgi:methylmalonyl-CoA mutase C-terminal domain/subunit
MAQAVIDEDADIVGLSFSSAAYVEYTRQLVAEMHSRGVGEVPVMLGGIIHPDDHADLREIGVTGIFGPGASTEEIIAFVKSRGRPG